MKYFAELVEQCRVGCADDAEETRDTAEGTVRSLWFCAAGQLVSAAAALDLELPPLTLEAKQRLADLLKLRELGTPLAYLTRRQRFMGLEYVCSDQALIPRKHTEILGEAAAELLRRHILPKQPAAQVLDLCTGSGNLACAIAARCPACFVFAADISSDALALASMNARRLGCSDRVKLVCGDLFAPFESARFYEAFDLIMCNPPHVDPSQLPVPSPEAILQEPRIALDGGPLGVRLLWRLLHAAPRFLKPGGWLTFEVGLGQGNGLVRRLSRDPRFAGVRGWLDPAGKIRAISGQLRKPDHASMPGAVRQRQGTSSARG